MSFTFIDLFAGIGGFHAALGSLGGTCVFASDIDDRARAIYAKNWGHEMRPFRGKRLLVGDIAEFTTPTVQVPRHDVLAAGFPCQPFSKSGAQRGMDEARGTLFWHIARIIEARRPSLVILENVRNIAGPRHRHEWHIIIQTLREFGYRVSERPAVFSPHLMPPELGGTPQVRERVFIAATRVGVERALAETDTEPAVSNSPINGWTKNSWNLEEHLLLPEGPETEPYRLDEAETFVIDVWDDFVRRLIHERGGERLPGFPIWADAFSLEPRIGPDTPTWKADFLKKNSDFYRAHKRVIDSWFADHNALKGLPPSRRKLEWQAQDAPSLWETVMHFRPSGIRAKLPTYVPALVAITQTSIVGPRRRRLTPREAARLQGLPDAFDLSGQRDADSYRQLGNAVCVGAVQHVVREHVRLDAADLPRQIVKSVLGA